MSLLLYKNKIFFKFILSEKNKMLKNTIITVKLKKKVSLKFTKLPDSFCNISY